MGGAAAAVLRAAVGGGRRCGGGGLGGGCGGGGPRRERVDALLQRLSVDAVRESCSAAWVGGVLARPAGPGPPSSAMDESGWKAAGPFRPTKLTLALTLGLTLAITLALALTLPLTQALQLGAC